MEKLILSGDWSHSLTWYFQSMIRFFILFFFVHTFLAGIFIVPTSSMEPAILAGDLALVNRTPFLITHSSIDRWVFPRRPIERNDIVAFRGSIRFGSQSGSPVYLVKRVAGLPGEALQIRKGLLIIDGRQVSYPAYLPWKPFPADSPKLRNWPPALVPLDNTGRLISTPQGPALHIPEGHLFCLGDNRDNSLDSRVWGPLPVDQVFGTPWRVIWSLHPREPGPAAQSLFQKIWDGMISVYRFFVQTRWRRLGHRYR